MNDFNKSPSTIMHIDLNSCFATIEQQANPFLRGKPLAVAAYDSPGGCILASSVEAKELGIKTGMRVKEGRLIYPALIVLEPDPDKYRHVHLALREVFRDYTNNFIPRSIDEFVLDFTGYPILKNKDMFEIGKEIGQRIKKEIGDWLMVSIGIGPCRFIAKTASNLKKPNGLEEINCKNYLEVYSKLKLTDLTGIASRNEIRLKGVGIGSVIDFYHSPIWKLKAAFSSINGYYWYLRLRGYEIDGVEFSRRSFGNSYAMPYSNGGLGELLPILQKLCEKTGQRLREAGFKAQGISVFAFYRDRSHWHRSKTLSKEIFDSRDIYKEALKIFQTCPAELQRSGIHTIAVSCFNLKKTKTVQCEFFADVEKKKNLVSAIDSINETWGDFVVTPARMALTGDLIKDRIAFGSPR